MIGPDWVDSEIAAFTALLEGEFEAAKSYLPNKADWFEGAWAGLSRPQDAITERRNVATGSRRGDGARGRRRSLTTVPEDLAVHKTLARIVDARREMFESGEGFDWATAEALAFGTLLREGHPVRLSGQDSGRGTFSQRHAVWVDQKDGAQIYPAHPGRPGPLRGARQPALRIRRARLRIWLFARRPADPGAVGGAVRRFRQRRPGDHRPVHRRRRGQVAARQRPRPAAAARLRRAGAGAQLGPARALPAALRRGQYPGRQLHDPGQLFPHPAPPDAPRLPQAAGDHDAQVAAPPQDGGLEPRRLHRRQPFPAHPLRSRTRPPTRR